MPKGQMTRLVKHYIYYTVSVKFLSSPPSADRFFDSVCTSRKKGTLYGNKKAPCILHNAWVWYKKKKSHKDSIRIVITHEDCGNIEILNDLWYNVINSINWNLADSSIG